MHQVKPGVFTLGMLLLAGCSSTIHERFSIDSPTATSLSLDAKQRLFVVTDKGGADHQQHVACAEPSPDSVVGVAASGALEGSFKTEASAKIAGSMAEAIGELGQRTPTIQLLRDGLYRACEAYMNGIYTTVEYQQILRGYDDFVVTLLAVEGLTQRPQLAKTLVQAQTEARTGTTSEGKTPALPPAAANALAAAQISPEVASTVKDILSSYYSYQVTLAGVAKPKPGLDTAMHIRNPGTGSHAGQ